MRKLYPEDGTKMEKICPKCGKHQLEFEMSFQDQFSYTTGHYTIDDPILYCPEEECGYVEDYEIDDENEDW